MRSSKIKDFIVKHTGKYYCKCGCGGVIKILPQHLYIGIPKCLQYHGFVRLKNRIITRVCACGCGETFSVPVTNGRRGKHRYVLGHNRRGTTFSLTKEQIRKAVLANTGRKHSQESKEKMRKAKIGKKLTEEHKIKIGLGQTGKKHWNYIDGRKLEYDYPSEFNRRLKDSIQGRDGYKCYCCGATDKLTIHHIDYNKHNCSDLNLITTCCSCNILANYGRDYWFAFYTYKINEIYGKPNL